MKDSYIVGHFASECSQTHRKEKRKVSYEPLLDNSEKTTFLVCFNDKDHQN